jgi:hypothetical protein
MTEKNRGGVFSGTLRGLDSAISAVMQATTSLPGNLVSEVERFRMVREKTLGMLEDLSAQQALWCPRPRAWSIAQIADHLLLSEQLYREQFRTLIRTAKEGRNSTITIGFKDVDSSIGGIPREVIRLFELPVRMFSQFVPRTVLETMVRFPIMSALNPKISDPRHSLKIETLIADLNTSLAETEKVLLARMPANIEKPVVDHPIMGRNNLPQLLRSVIAHEERHHRQIDAVRSDARFPKGAATQAI